MDVKGQSAIVTGGGSGLGAETARYLAKAGAKVAIFDVNMTGAKTVADEIGGVAIECDVSKTPSVEAAFEASNNAVGGARVLINCAGIGTADRIVDKEGVPMDMAKFEKVISVNLLGSFNCLRLAAADMAKLDPLAEGERGVIISTASVAAYEGQIGQIAYAASKGGVAGLTLPAARDLMKLGVRVVTIAPGLFDTPLLAGIPEKIRDALGAGIPFPQRLGRPEEYARLVESIVGNPYLNGEVIRLDGALRMPPK